jgi:hypothetical protein
MKQIAAVFIQKNLSESTCIRHKKPQIRGVAYSAVQKIKESVLPPSFSALFYNCCYASASPARASASVIFFD